MYFQLYDILEKAKLLLQKAYKRFLGPRVGLGIDKKKKKKRSYGTLWGDGFSKNFLNFSKTRFWWQLSN